MATIFTLKRKLFAFGVQSIKMLRTGVDAAGKALTAGGKAKALAGAVGGVGLGIGAAGAVGAGIAAKKIDNATNGIE